MLKMGFLEHFQQHNQTLEKTFQSIFWNATKYLKIFSFPENILHLKIFYTLKIYYTQPNAALNSNSNSSPIKRLIEIAEVLWCV